MNRMIKGSAIATVLVIGIAFISSAAVYAVSRADHVIDVGRGTKVYTFRHDGNRCYVTNNAGFKDTSSISCVRFE